MENPDLSETINAMLSQEGFYMVTDSSRTPMEMTPIISVGGKLYALAIAERMDPNAFSKHAFVNGPIIPRFKEK